MYNTQQGCQIFCKYCHSAKYTNKAPNIASNCAQWKCIQVHMNNRQPGGTTNLVAFQSNQLPLKYTGHFLFCKIPRQRRLASKHRHEIQTKGYTPSWRRPACDGFYHPHGPATPLSPCWPLLTPGCQATHHLEPASIPLSLMSLLLANGSKLHSRQKWKKKKFFVFQKLNWIPQLKGNLVQETRQKLQFQLV